MLSFFDFFVDLGNVPTLIPDERTPLAYRIVLFLLTLAAIPMLAVGVALLYWFVVASGARGSTPFADAVTWALVGIGGLFMVLAFIRLILGQEATTRRESLPESETLESHLRELEQSHVAEMRARGGEGR